MSDKLKVLFLCTGNSCRSQMAEGFCRQLCGDAFDCYSAGLEAHGLNPYAVQVMRESGVDISTRKSKTVSELGNIQFDYVITVCGHADENCPVFLENTTVIHRGFDDPPKLAAAMEDEVDRLDCYRRVRDEIKAFIETLPDDL